MTEADIQTIVQEVMRRMFAENGPRFRLQQWEYWRATHYCRNRIQQAGYLAFQQSGRRRYGHRFHRNNAQRYC